MESEQIKKAVEDLEENAKQLKSIVELHKELGESQSKLDASCALLKSSFEGIEEIKKSIQRSSEENDKQLKSTHDLLREKIQELYNDGKAFQKELDQSLKTRLDKQESDILVQIRTTGTELQTAISKDTDSRHKLIEAKLETNFTQTENTLKDALATQSKQYFWLRIILVILLIMGTAILSKLLSN